MKTGETFVYGRDKDTARALLNACDVAGYGRHVVRATESGFIVPNAVWDAAAKVLTAPEPEAVF